MYSHALLRALHLLCLVVIKSKSENKTLRLANPDLTLTQPFIQPEGSDQLAHLLSARMLMRAPCLLWPLTP